MEKITILPILKKIPLFQTFNEEDYHSIIENIKLEYFPKSHLIFSENDEGDSLYIIKSGHVTIFHSGESLDDEEIIARLKENDFFGEMALFSDEKRNASAKTESECEIFTLKKKDFCSLLLQDENMASRVSDEFLKRLRENNEKEI